MIPFARSDFATCLFIFWTLFTSVQQHPQNPAIDIYVTAYPSSVRAPDDDDDFRALLWVQSDATTGPFPSRTDRWATVETLREGGNRALYAKIRWKIGFIHSDGYHRKLAEAPQSEFAWNTLVHLALGGDLYSSEPPMFFVLAAMNKRKATTFLGCVNLLMLDGPKVSFDQQELVLTLRIDEAGQWTRCPEHVKWVSAKKKEKSKRKIKRRKLFK